MEIIVLQHIKIEDPGYIKDLMIKDGVNLTTIELDEGEKIPNDLNKFDAMFCMGGPMDTWMEQEYPWLVEEKNKIKEFVVNLEKPYLGFCLGCQLLGEVIGGSVVRTKNPEIGMLNINFSEEKENDTLFSEFPEKLTSLQWHSYEVQNLENNKDLDHVFQRFWKGQGTGGKESGRSGLGLAIVRQIVEGHGGQVTVRSQLGSGATFTIWLPRYIAA